MSTIKPTWFTYSLGEPVIVCRGTYRVYAIVKNAGPLPAKNVTALESIVYVGNSQQIIGDRYLWWISSSLEKDKKVAIVHGKSENKVEVFNALDEINLPLFDFAKSVAGGDDAYDLLIYSDKQPPPTPQNWGGDECPTRKYYKHVLPVKEGSTRFIVVKVKIRGEGVVWGKRFELYLTFDRLKCIEDLIKKIEDLNDKKNRKEFSKEDEEQWNRYSKSLGKVLKALTRPPDNDRVLLSYACPQSL